MADKKDGSKKTESKGLEFLKSFLTSLIGDVSVGVLLKKYVDEHGKDVTKSIKFKISGEHRARLFSYIAHMKDDAAKKGLKKHYHRIHECNKKQPGLEDRCVKLLSELLYCCEECKLDPEIIFNELGKMPEKEFEEALDFLEQDWFSQLMKRTRLSLKDGLQTVRALDRKLAPAAAYIKKEARRIKNQRRNPSIVSRLFNPWRWF